MPIGTKKQPILVPGVVGNKDIRRGSYDIGGLDIVISVRLPKNSKIFEIKH